MEKQEFIEAEPVAPVPEEEYEQTFAKKHLAILASSYDGFVVGIQDFSKKTMSPELRLVEIDGLQGSSDKHFILNSILEFLPEARVDFKKFKNAVEEAVGVLSDGKAKISFPDEKYINYALECMEEDSWEPAVLEGGDILQGVGKIFGLDKSQLQGLEKELK